MVHATVKFVAVCTMVAWFSGIALMRTFYQRFWLIQQRLDLFDSDSEDARIVKS